MKKSLTLIILIVLAALAVIFLIVGRGFWGGRAMKGLNVYRSATFGFEFRYPSHLLLSEGSDATYSVGTSFIAPGVSVATVGYPKGSYPETNFSHAFLTVSVSNQISDENSCREFERPGGERVRSNEAGEINGVAAYLHHSNGAAAGTKVDQRAYHLFQHSRCYEISMNLFTTDTGAYESGTVREVDAEEIWDTLETVAATLRFVPISAPLEFSYLYRLSDYPTKDARYTGPVAEVKWESNPRAREFRTKITEAMRQGVNFAGKYVIAEWGCGTSCQGHAMVDASTGEIVSLGLPSAYGLEFSSESRLLIVNPPKNIPQEFVPALETDYYEFVNGTLRLLAKQKPGEREAMACIQTITTARNPISGEIREFPSPCAVPFYWQVVEPGSGKG